MNSSQILKRTLPIALIILLIIGIAVFVPIIGGKRQEATIDKAGDTYLEIEENSRKFSITNGEIYDKLKSSVGLTIMLDKIDRHLLSNYIEKVTEDELKEEIEKAMYPKSTYPNGKSDLKQDEIDKIEKEFFENLYLELGLKNDGARNKAIDDYYKLIIARRKNAVAALEKEIKETDEKAAKDSKLEKYFTDKEYENYYKSNYANGYWAVIVPFTSREEAEAMLKQLGYKFHAYDSSIAGDYTKWVKEEEVEEVERDAEGNPIKDSEGNDVTKKVMKERDLTAVEVVQAFIDMYNAVNSSKAEGYPNNANPELNNILKEGVEYKYVKDEEGNITKIEFNTILNAAEDHAENRFYWSNEKIKKYQSEIQNYLKVSLNSYNSDQTINSGKSWFTPQLRDYNNSQLYVYVLKIDEVKAKEQAEVQSEIYKALFDAEITDSYISKAMAELRKEKNLVIYDQTIEKNYIDSISATKVEYTKNKKGHKEFVASIDGLDLKANELFKIMDERFGATIATSEINFLRLLNSDALNKIYRYHLTDEKEAKKIIDEEKWKKIRDRAVNEKRNFAANAYANYGFPATYGWNNFLRDYYGLSSSEELPYYFLYAEILSEFATGLGTVKDLNADSELWKLYQGKMTKTAEDYFSVTGIHLLIYVNDAEGKPVNPDKWTDAQRALASELYGEVWKYYNEETGTPSEKLKKIQDEFKKAPRFLADKEQEASAQPSGFDYKFEEAGKYSFEFSKAKTIGLQIKFEDLGTFTNGKMVKEFEAVVREIWKNDPKDESSKGKVTIYDKVDETTLEPKLKTEFGYHAYINTGVQDITRWDAENKDIDKNTIDGVLPTLQMVKTYLKDNASAYLLDDDGNETDVEFTSAMKTAVTTYYKPIFDELTGSYNSTSELYAELKSLDITFNSGNYSRETWEQFIDLRVKSYKSKLKYLTDEE